MKQSMYKVLTGAILCAGFLAVPVQGADFEATMGKGGLSLSKIHQISLFSRIIAVQPPWQYKYFYSAESPIAVEESVTADGEKCITIKQTSDEKFHLSNYSAVNKGDHGVVITLSGEMTEPLPYLLEHSAMMIPERILAGATYTVVHEDGSSSDGKIPEEFDGEPGKVKDLVNSIKSIFFDGPYGKLSITVDEGAPLQVTDRRSLGFDISSETATKGFWVGCSQSMDPGAKYHQVITVNFQQRGDLFIAPEIAPRSEYAEVKKTDALAQKLVADLPVFPAVKEFIPAEGTTSLGNITTSLVNAFTEDYDRLQKALADFKAFCGENDNTKPAVNVIAVQMANNYYNLELPAQPDGYVISAEGDNRIIVAARTPRGVFHGLQTLRQIAENGEIPNGLIRDWPDFAERSILIMPDNNSVNFHGNLIRKVLVPAKINALYIECEYAAWDSLANVRQPWAISKEDLKELIAIARENYIDVYPLFQTLGHSEYLFANGQNIDMAEDPEHPYAYFSQHPDVYPLMTRCLDEVREVFDNPTRLHIGHDEVNMFGKFPNRPESVEKGGGQIVIDDILFYYDYARKHNMELMIWQDMFVTHTRGFGSTFNHMGLDQRRGDLPKDILFAFWDYEKDVNKDQVKQLRDDNFRVWGCTWFDLDNIKDMAKTGRENNFEGLMATTWAGYFGSWDVLDREYHQIASYIPLLGIAWDSKTDIDTPTAGERLFFALNVDAPCSLPAEGNTVNLDGWANLEVIAANQPFLLDDLCGFDKLPREIRAGEILFQVPHVNGNVGAIAVKSRCNPSFSTESPAVKLNLNAKKLFFLHTMFDNGLAIDPGTDVADYIVTYADGSEEIVPIRFGKDILRAKDQVNHALPPTRHYQAENGALWVQAWDNPYPEKAIVSLRLRAAYPSYPVYWFGLSAQ